MASSRRGGGRGTQIITAHDDPDAPGEALIALLFPRGARPAATTIANIADVSGAFAISHRPAPDADWLELLATGLTFELAGLSPGTPAEPPEIRHRYPLELQLGSEAEAIILRPGPHLAAAGAMIPVTRAAVALACALSEDREAIAVVWLPAGVAMTPGYFIAIAGQWLSGGPFPAMGLTALVRTPDGGIRSEGVKHFIGQEIEVFASGEGATADDAKLAARAVHTLVTSGPLRQSTRLTGPDGEPLMAEPSADGATVTIWRRN